MGRLDELRNEADSGSFWKPEVGEDKIVKIRESVQIGQGESWLVEDLVSQIEFYLPKYGNLKKKNLQEGKSYFIRCTRKSILTVGIGKGKESRVFFVKELTPNEADDLAKEMALEDKIDF